MKKVCRYLALFFFAAFVITTTGCKKDSEIPTLSTIAVSPVTSSSATTGGTVSSTGGTQITSRGVCWSTNANPTVADNKTTDGGGSGTFTSTMTGLTENTRYYVRAYATNGTGTGYGDEISFNMELKATLTSSVASSGPTYAVVAGLISDKGGSTIVERGICWSTNRNPTMADGIVTYDSDSLHFACNLSGLEPGTEYYARAYAINGSGTAYSDQVSFKTKSSVDQPSFAGDLAYGTVSDIDGNIYKTIQVGSQVWMAENLRTTKFNNGDPILYLDDNSDWTYNSAEAYCWYNNDAVLYKEAYGALYNWFTVKNAELCPAGWHVPDISEWTTLATSLGGESVAGDRLKETGLTHWGYPNTGSNNNTGWTGLPGGVRISNGEFGGSGFNGVWWTTDESQGEADITFLDNSSHSLEFDFIGKKYGASVRCVEGSK